MSITGKALTVERKKVVSPCGFTGLAGYKTNEGEGEHDAHLSFMPKTHKPELKIKVLNVDGKEAEVIKHLMSKHIPGMWTFYIKYQE